MNKIESLAIFESNSPQFQKLSPEQQNHRRGLLSDILGTIIENGHAFGYTPKETGIFVSLALELYLTGNISNVEKHPKKRSKSY